MKKVGLITWFRDENYGTKLQAFSLQKFLRINKIDIELVNYNICNKANKDNKLSLKQRIKRKLNHILFKIDKLFYKNEYTEKSQKFDNFIKNNFKLSKYVERENDYINLCNSYDYLLFGSDQIWNPNWYHPFYYGNFDEIKTKRISYAPSFGISKIDIKNENYNHIASGLKKFDKISVREEEGSKIVKKMIDKDVPTVVDPTLLLSADDWKLYEEDIDVKKEYIFCYFLSDNINHIKAVKKFAKQEKLEVISIPNGFFTAHFFNNQMRSASVGQFLSLIKNAKYVCTDSFHGTVFSIIYRKDFYLFERHNPCNDVSQNSRLTNLLKMIDLSDRMIKYNTKNITFGKMIDYNNVYNKLSIEIDNSKKYLLDSLEESKR